MSPNAALRKPNRLDHSWPRAAAIALLSLGTLILVLQALFSLRWPNAGDGAYLHYVVYLIDRHDFVPYRDVFEVSLPLTYWFHMAIGRTLGYGDLAFRVVDLAYLSVLSLVTWRMLRPLGWLVAWAAALTFGLLYQSYGPLVALQREFLCLLPAAVAVWLAGQPGRRRWRYVAIGALFGVAMSIKPHFLIGLPPVLFYALLSGADAFHWRRPHWRALVEAALLAGLGLALAVTPPLLWAWRSGGLPSLWTIMTRFVPVYNRLSGDLTLMSTGYRVIHTYNGLQEFGGKVGLWMMAALGVYFALFERRLAVAQRRLVILLVVLTFAYVVYEIFAGKFWYYHWLPFYYFAVCCGALVLLPLHDRESARGSQWFALAVFGLGLFLTVRPAPDFDRQLRGLGPEPLAGGRAAAMTAFLTDNLRPGDTVQPLDGVMGGSTTALLRAGAPLATPYINDEQFFHNVSNPYIQSLRADFLARLEAAPPRFFLSVPGTPDPNEADAGPFPELWRFIAGRYRVALEGDGFVIYERAGDS